MATAPLTPAMQRALTVYQETGKLDGVRANTRAALERRGLVTTRETLDVQRPNRLVLNWFERAYRVMPTYDIGQTDYGYWDRAIRCLVPGMEIAGLLLKPLQSKKAAWVMGMAPKFKFKRPKTQKLYSEWFAKHQPDVIRAYEEAVGKADSYLVVNPPDENGDLPLTVIPPNVVTPIVDENDYSRKLGYRISQVYAHPTRVADTMNIVDEYMADKRVRKIYKGGALIETQEFKNLLGRIPVIKISHDRGSDEEYGHPIGEALIAALKAYGDVVIAGIQGNIKQGRPTPVIEKMGGIESIKAWWREFGHKEQYELPDGTTQEKWVLDLSSDDAMTLGGDATFKYAQPGSFSTDMLAILGLLYWLFIEHTEFPEFIMGTAISSSHASADAQMPPFIKFIEKNQGEALYWMIELAQVVIAYLSLYEAGVSADDPVTIQWPKLTSTDGKLTLDAIKLGLEKNLIDRETALTLMPLDIDDPKAVLAKVEAELEADRERQAQEDQRRFGDIEVADQLNENPPDSTPQEALDHYVQTLSEAAHSSVMIAFMLDNTAAENLIAAVEEAEIENVTPAKEMHLTLAMLGKTDDLDVTEEEVMQALGDFAQGEFSLRGVISGVGLFTNNQDADVNPLYASFDSPDLPAFRQALVEHLAEKGIAINTEHGFTPHITLAYIPADDPMPDIKLPDITLVFDQLSLAWGDNVSHFELKGEAVTA